MKRRPQKSQPTLPTKIVALPGSREQLLADFATLRIPLTAAQLDVALSDAQQNGRSHLEFLQRRLADQAGSRRQRRIERLIKEAHFREALPLSTFDWSFNPTIPRLQLEALAQGDFIRRQQNVAFVGQSGLGKSRLIQSIGLAACMLEQRVRYILERLESGQPVPVPRPPLHRAGTLSQERLEFARWLKDNERISDHR